jgi:hypothetical protein
VASRLSASPIQAAYGQPLTERSPASRRQLPVPGPPSSESSRSSPAAPKSASSPPSPTSTFAEAAPVSVSPKPEPVRFGILQSTPQAVAQLQDQRARVKHQGTRLSTMYEQTGVTRWLATFDHQPTAVCSSSSSGHYDRPPCWQGTGLCPFVAEPTPPEPAGLTSRIPQSRPYRRLARHRDLLPPYSGKLLPRAEAGSTPARAGQEPMPATRVPSRR